MTGLIQSEQNTELSKHFTIPAENTCTTSGTIFSADVWISGGRDFSIQTWCIPLEAFASKKSVRIGAERIYPFIVPFKFFYMNHSLIITDACHY